MKTAHPRSKQGLRWAGLILCGALMTGCRLDMHIQPKYKGFEPSSILQRWPLRASARARDRGARRVEHG